MGKAHRARIFTNVDELRSELRLIWPRRYITMASGGCDPAHLGHVDYIQAAAEIKLEEDNPLLVVVVNGHDWLIRKKGYAFMPENERANIIASISGVDYVLIWDDGTPTVCGAIEALVPDFFAKGGDRDSKFNVPEYAICESIGCEVVFGVGGGKIQSSSELVNKASKHIK